MNQPKKPRKKQAARGKPLPYLASWRSYRLLDQSTLAKRAEVSRATVLRAERDKTAIVSYATIGKLADALKARADMLLFPPPEQASGDSGDVTQDKGEADASR